MSIRPKMRPLDRTQDFFKIWPSDLVFDLHDPFSKSSEISSRQSFWPIIMSIRLEMWPLERIQGFSKFWPSDLIFDPTWPNFKLVQSLIEGSILTIFMCIWPIFMSITLKMWPLERIHGFYRIWPSDLVFDPTWHSFELVQDLIEADILTIFMNIWLKMLPIERTQDFCKIWPSDLVFDRTIPIFQFVQDFTKTKMLMKFHDYQKMWPLEHTQGFFLRFDIVT